MSKKKPPKGAKSMRSSSFSILVIVLRNPGVGLEGKKELKITITLSTLDCQRVSLVVENKAATQGTGVAALFELASTASYHGKPGCRI